MCMLTLSAVVVIHGSHMQASSESFSGELFPLGSIFGVEGMYALKLSSMDPFCNL